MKLAPVLLWNLLFLLIEQLKWILFLLWNLSVVMDSTVTTEFALVMLPVGDMVLDIITIFAGIIIKQALVVKITEIAVSIETAFAMDFVVLNSVVVRNCGVVMRNDIAKCCLEFNSGNSLDPGGLLCMFLFQAKKCIGGWELGLMTPTLIMKVIIVKDVIEPCIYMNRMILLYPSVQIRGPHIHFGECI